jgi:hypothetical protein
MDIDFHIIVANFQRDGRSVHDDNQGSRPNYPSTQEILNLPPRAYNDANHTVWVCVVIGVVGRDTRLIMLTRSAEPLDTSRRSRTSTSTGRESSYVTCQFVPY